jgi:hemerythrin
VREHAAFRTRTAQFFVDSVSRKSGLSVEMLDYLQNWLVNHILESDLGFRDFLIQNGFLPNRNAVSEEFLPATTTPNDGEPLKPE